MTPSRPASVFALAYALTSAALAHCGPTLHETQGYTVAYTYDPNAVITPVAVVPYVRVEQPPATVVRFEVPTSWSYTWSPATRVRVLCGGASGVFTPTLEYDRRYVVAIEGSWGASDCRVGLAEGPGVRVIYRGDDGAYGGSNSYVLRPVRYRMDL